MLAGTTVATRGTGAVEFVERIASQGERVALHRGDESITYAQLDVLVADAGARLGDERSLVQISGGNDLETVVTYLAALRGGHVVLMTAPDEPRRSEMEGIYEPDTTARRGDTWTVERSGSAPRHDLHPDLALLLSTSGSTGSPKCVRLSRHNLSSNADAIASYLGLDEDSVGITSLPLHYCYGLSVLHSHLAVGASVVLTENSVLDDCFWASVRDHGVTSIAGVPHTFDLLERAGFDRRDLPSLRTVTQAGGRLAPDRVRHYAELGTASGWDFVVMYGQTEATARMAYLPPHLASERPGAVGVAVPGGSLEIDEAVGPGDGTGEVVYSGPNVMMGYAHGADDLWRGDEVARLRTGDIGRIADDGLLEITGRLGRFAKLFGLRIDLDELERHLGRLGFESLCVERDGVLVVGTTGNPPEAREAVVGRLGIPPGSVRVEHLVELPLTSSGKPDRSGLGAAPVDQPAGDEVRGVLSRCTGATAVGDDDTFVSLGGDSLSYVEASTALERVVGTLPAGWHTLPVSQLERLGGRRSPLASVDTTVVLRALAIALVVGSHASVFRVRGGAHLLLVIAGLNLARFTMGAPTRSAMVDSTRRSLTRIVVPSALWLGALTLLTDHYGLTSITFTNAYLGPRNWDPAWRYWFIEALLWATLLAVALATVGPLRRWNRRQPLAIPLVLLATGLLFRYDVVSLPGTVEPLLAPHRVLWLFAIGLAIPHCTSLWRRLAITAGAGVALVGFFPGEESRAWLVAAGVALVVWVPSVPFPRWGTRVLALVAGASLYIYLTHFSVYMALEDRGWPPIVGAVASLVVGVACWKAVERLGRSRAQASAPVADDTRAAAERTSSPWRSPGRGPIRSTGPETESAATTPPVGSVTGAETLATPASRSSTDSTQPRPSTVVPAST